MAWESSIKQYKRIQAEKARRKRELKTQIYVLERQRNELFEVLAFQKAIDEDFVRKEAIRVYTELKQLQTQYDAI